MPHGILRMVVKLTSQIWNYLLFLIIIISRNKDHTVIEWVFMLKYMNYITNTAIDYSITNLLSVFYIILLRKRLSVQPERHKALCRINYLRKNRTTWLGLRFIFAEDPWCLEAKVLRFNATAPRYQGWALRPSFIHTAAGWLNSSPPTVHRHRSLREAWREIQFLHRHW